MEIDAPVPQGPDRLVKPLATRKPEYFLCGPIVFSAVSQEFVNTLDAKWWPYLLRRVSPIATRTRDNTAFPGEELVVATTMFPHPTVEGYEDVSGFVLASVNGVRVKSLHHAAELVRDAKGKHIELRFAERGVEDVVIRTDALGRATEAVLADNGIRSRSSAGLKDVWK